MEYGEFEARAEDVWDEIPDAYRSGVDGLVLRKDERLHPTIPDIYTLGECLTESYPSDFGGPDSIRSVLVLYYGSFVRLSELDPDFDWRYEIWETITHELRHHLESLAAEDALEDVDYAMDENFKRFQEEPFDPFFYRSGEPLSPGLWAAERDVFIEIEYDERTPPGATAEFSWQGRAYSVPLPADLGQVTFVQVVDGLDTEDVELCLVLVRRSGFWRGLSRWIRRESTDIVQAEAVARISHGD